MVSEPEPDEPLQNLGLSDQAVELYRAVLRHPGESAGALSDRLGRTPAQLAPDLDALTELRLIRVSEDAVQAEPPDLALGRLVAERDRQLRDEEQRIAVLQAAIPEFVSVHREGRHGRWEPVGIEAVSVPDIVETMRMLTRNSTGELLFLRPDQHLLPSGQLMDSVVIDALRSGRRSRAIYPASIRDEATPLVHQRLDAGEQVRLMPQVPVRLAIFGEVAALVPEHWSSTAGRRLVVRQPALVRALVELFNGYWGRAVPMTGTNLSVDPSGRRQLLELLGHGAKDDQIARAMGLSVRTVRRRVAGMLGQLGVESRFQAGMEAVRRGWI